MKKFYLIVITFIFSIVLIGCNDVDTSLTTENITSEQTTDNPTTEELVILRDTYFQYSTNSTQNILITNLEMTDDYYLTDLDGNILNSADIIEENEFFEIKSQYLLENTEDIIEFYLYFNHYKTKVIITKNQKVEPYIISSSVVYTDGGSNLVFQFELFNGEIRQVTGTNLTSGDYSIEDKLLTVNSEYIDSEFDSMEVFTLNFVLDSDGLVLGLIRVEKK